MSVSRSLVGEGGGGGKRGGGERGGGEGGDEGVGGNRKQ